MPKPSKEEKVLELFFNYSTKPWHFEKIVKKTKMSRSNVTKWLKRFVKEGLVKRVKEKGKMPYFVCDIDNPAFFNRKTLFGLEKLYVSNLLNHLVSLKKARTVVVFGSIARGEWDPKSDVDIFIYGSDEDFEIHKYESLLKREMQVFVAKNKKDLNSMGSSLLKNIATGFFVKGGPDFLE